MKAFQHSQDVYRAVERGIEYWRSGGHYSVVRQLRSDGCPSCVSIMHPRHAALRARIDAAIAAIAG
ncbi:hypothetical protein [Burkholderia multivorans]|uniref:hypothetical protein n=1 Tax=Burkholderia multivorans TaxID=87883 RepID=UPI001589CE11|nr:hypothetical protein [Burkholderia multivorans]